MITEEQPVATVEMAPKNAAPAAPAEPDEMDIEMDEEDDAAKAEKNKLAQEQARAREIQRAAMESKGFKVKKDYVPKGECADARKTTLMDLRSVWKADGCDGKVPELSSAHSRDRAVGAYPYRTARPEMERAEAKARRAQAASFSTAAGCRRRCVSQGARERAYGSVRRRARRGRAETTRGRGASASAREGKDHLGWSHCFQGYDGIDVPKPVQSTGSDACDAGALGSANPGRSLGTRCRITAFCTSTGKAVQGWFDQSWSSRPIAAVHCQCGASVRAASVRSGNVRSTGCAARTWRPTCHAPFADGSPRWCASCTSRRSKSTFRGRCFSACCQETTGGQAALWSALQRKPFSVSDETHANIL